MNQRISSIIQEFDAQGWHRTGTETDNRSARWLVDKGRSLGLDLELERFEFDRVVPRDCYLEINGRRIQGLPFFDGGFTSPDGISGRIGPIGSGSEIGLGEIVRGTNQASQDFRRSPGHLALVAVTLGGKPGLMATNAPAFRQPFGPPVLQVSSEEQDWLTGHAQGNSLVRLVAAAERVGAESFNVTGRVKGSSQTLPPVIVMTPRSGWWQCASERGRGLACWLEVVRHVVSSRPGRDVIFVATSAHELGLLGLDNFLGRRPGLAERAHVWLHFGADVGLESQVSFTDDELKSQTLTALEDAGASPVTHAPYGTTVGAESLVVAGLGGRVVALIGHSALFHLESDRWAQGFDTDSIGRFANAFANLALQLSKS
ncbi:MAG: hypothetical protein CL696_08830 [Chloroflexi bacterium]|nr:hypothetical protein [Chloroflexota bacterium]